MGDRAVIGIKQSRTTDTLYFYTHWRGSEVCEVLAEGIDKAQSAGRLSDQAYATRIIFDTLTGLEDSTTGFGIIVGDGNVPGDCDYEIPVLWWDLAGRDRTAKVTYRGKTYDAHFFAAFFSKATV